jgi:hypothetical protein
LGGKGPGCFPILASHFFFHHTRRGKSRQGFSPDLSWGKKRGAGKAFLPRACAHAISPSRPHLRHSEPASEAKPQRAPVRNLLVAPFRSEAEERRPLESGGRMSKRPPGLAPRRIIKIPRRRYSRASPSFRWLGMTEIGGFARHLIRFLDFAPVGCASGRYARNDGDGGMAGVGRAAHFIPVIPNQRARRSRSERQ